MLLLFLFSCNRPEEKMACLTGEQNGLTENYSTWSNDHSTTGNNKPAVLNEQTGDSLNPVGNNCDTTLKLRKPLGKTGYSLLVPQQYKLTAENDTTYLLEVDNDKIYGKLSLTFIRPEYNPEQKVGDHTSKDEYFKDIICNSDCSLFQYTSLGCTIIQGEFTDKKSRVRIMCLSRNKDGNKPETAQRDRLYCILRSLHKDKK